MNTLVLTLDNVIKYEYEVDMKRNMTNRAFVLCLLAVFLCLSLGSCKKELTREGQEKGLEVSEGENGREREDVDSLDHTTSENKIEAGGMRKKDVIIHKTKAQYAIY